LCGISEFEENEKKCVYFVHNCLQSPSRVPALLFLVSRLYALSRGRGSSGAIFDILHIQWRHRRLPAQEDTHKKEESAENRRQRSKEHGKFPSVGMGDSVARFRGVVRELHALFLRFEYATDIVITSVNPAVVEKPGSVILTFPRKGISVYLWMVTHFCTRVTIVHEGIDVVTVNFLRTLRFDPRILRTIHSPYRAHVQSDSKNGQENVSFTSSHRSTAAHVHDGVDEHR